MATNDIQFEDRTIDSNEESVSIEDMEAIGESTTTPKSSFPKCLLPVGEKQLDELRVFLDYWYQALKSSHAGKIDEWTALEDQYRARSQGPQETPFVGACGDTVPVSAMAVDPIHARLDTGIFKADPVFVFKPLKKSVTKFTPALEAWVQYYQKHKLNLRAVASPRILEMTKLGTMVFKTVYDHVKYKVKTYDSSWNVVEKEVTRFKGPRVYGISLGDFMFPPEYQHLQDCPITFERQRFYPTDLAIAEASGKLTNIDKVINQKNVTRDSLEVQRQEDANHVETSIERKDLVEVYEIWCDYDLNGDGLPEKLVITYHPDTRTFLQLRYNWYFHQRKPYTVIPYSVANDSLYGIGIGEMSSFFQEAQTKWHRMAQDNAYLANIRMFIAKKESGIEEVPKLYSGRTFFVDDPKSDFISFEAAEVYPSSLSERQNLWGLTEKRTGVSDYLTGRESPIIGSRATATATTALIQEGTRRVEEVLENVRTGFSEIIENCLYIWIQYGLDGVDDLVFGDDEIGAQLKEFFDSVNQENVHGALAIDLSATDAANNRAIQQQVQLAIIQTMMQYLDKLVQAGQLAIQAAQTTPVLTQLIGDVMEAARNMFKDLLLKYDIRNPEDYLPDLEKYLNAAVGNQGVPAGPTGEPTGLEGQSGLPTVSGAIFQPPRPITPPAGVGVRTFNGL